MYLKVCRQKIFTCTSNKKQIIKNGKYILLFFKTNSSFNFLRSFWNSKKWWTGTQLFNMCVYYFDSENVLLLTTITNTTTNILGFYLPLIVLFSYTKNRGNYLVLVYTYKYISIYPFCVWLIVEQPGNDLKS